MAISIEIDCVHRAAMSLTMDEAYVGRVGEFFARIGTHLPLEAQRASFATYAFGILGDGDRKSVEPIAARAAPEPEETERMHDRLLHFVRESPWEDRPVRREAARYVTEAIALREPDSVRVWIVDDTGFPKQGRHSPGVQRQYTGSAGKITNCQIGVSLSIATPTEQVPIDFELYLPKSWTDDAPRRAAARIPESVTFKTKPELALDMIVRAIEDEIPGEVLLADTAYGDSVAFRQGVTCYGLDYAVAVSATTSVRLLDGQGHRRGESVQVQQLGLTLGESAFRRITWRNGTRSGPRGKLHSRFVFRRVKVAHDDGTDPRNRAAEWLVIEWPEGELKPTKFFLTTLRRSMSKKHVVRTIKERWKVERTYEEMKSELGLDHFEGRSFIGWHHHVSVVLCCYAFVVAERVRHFPPSRGGARRADALERAA
jgi:SRSO17 transposase